MSYRLAFEADAAQWALALFAAAAGAFFWRLSREAPLRERILRALAWGLLAAASLKPSLDVLRAGLRPPRLNILVDTGPSMQAKDGGGPSRLERAVSWLKSRRGVLENRAEVLLFAAGAGARRIAWEELDALRPSSAQADLEAALSDMSRAAAPPERIWLLSDGGLRLDLGGARSVPVDALSLGPRRARPELSVSSLRCPDFVFLHGSFPVAARLEASALAGAEVSVELWQGERLLASESRRVASNEESWVSSFTARAQALGSQEYRLRLAARGPAASGGRRFRVEVIRQKYRIMYLAGRPSFEYAHLRAHLKADPNHELVSFVILRNPENASPVPDQELSLIPFPASEIFSEDLFHFDLFILENFAYNRFNLPLAYLENLKRFVAQGGALLVLGGSNAFHKGGYRGTPLEELLPVSIWPEPDDFVPGLFKPVAPSLAHPLLALGDSPESSAALWEALPPLDGFSRFAALRPGASVLLTHPSERMPSGQELPVLAVKDFGKGKVLLLGSDSTWRWKLGGGERWRAASAYARFWGRIVQYLTGSLELKKVKFSPLPEPLPAEEPLSLSLRVFDAHFRAPQGEVSLRLLWTSPDGTSRSAPFFEKEPGVFQIELSSLKEGRHRLDAFVRLRGEPWGEDRLDFVWEKIPRGGALDRRRLKEWVESSGGRFLDLEAAGAEEALEPLSAPKPEPSVLRRVGLWDSPWWPAALCVALLLEWLLRRRRGCP